MEQEEVLDENKLSRRDFIKTTTIVAAAVAILPHIPLAETILKEVDAEQVANLQAQADQETAYVRGIGFDSANGQGSNLAQVYVKNGKIVRITSLDYTSQYTVDQIQPWSISARGQVFNPTLTGMIPPFSVAYKKRAYSPNRVMYPLQRVDFDATAAPADRNQANRGTSKYIRITWDEATTILANEIQRVRTTYGPSGVMTGGGIHGETKVIHMGHGTVARFFNSLTPPGSTTLSGSAGSWEGWYWGAKHVWGMTRWVGLEAPQTNVVPDTLQNTDMVLFWGADPEAHAWGWGGQCVSEVMFWFKQAGIKSVYICPDFNYGAAVHADKWIPIIPNTDVAMHLAIAYTWINEGTYDTDYVATHTIGFDEASLPAGAPAGSSFKNYVLGIVDGVPKTPKWAEGICGVPARTIKALARDWASKTTSTLHCNGGAMIRGPYTHENARTEVLLLAMQGVGKPGINQIKIIEALQDSLPAAVFKPSVVSYWPPAIPVGAFPENFFLQAITNPPVSWYGPSMGPWSPLVDQFKLLTYPAPGNSEVHMWWTDMSSLIPSAVNGNEIAAAYQNPKLEFIAMQVPWFENDCMFADLVLPVKTIFEVEDMGISAEEGRGEFVVAYYMGQCIDPIGESLSDYEIVSAVASKMGVTATWNPKGETVSQLVEDAFNFSGVNKLISYDDLKSKGYFVLPTDPNWADPTKYPTGISTFANAPTGTGLETPSGMIEFYSIGLMNHFPNDTERPPRPHYIADGVTHQESLFSPRAKQYPLLAVSDHPKWRVHGMMDDITWLREIPTCKITGPDGYKYEPIWINPVDAATRGIKQGDIVMMYNERGSVLGGAYVTERIMPGSVAQVHASRTDFIAPGKIDRGGSNNTIGEGNGLSANAPGICCSAFLVEVAKADMATLMAQYPAAFARVYDSTGSDYDSWVNSTPPSG